MRRSRPPEQAARILVVCTGNICRSPLAQALLGTALSAQNVVVDSAGTHAVVGAPPVAEAHAFAERHGLGPIDHVGYQFNAADARSADLILTMTRQQRSAVVTEAPSQLRRTFTLRELAAITQTCPIPAGKGLPATVNTAARHRSVVEGQDIDIPDPYGGSPEDYERIFTDLSRTCDRVIPALRDSLSP